MFILGILLILFAFNTEVIAQDRYSLCDYVSNNTQCQDPANNCQTLEDGICHMQADCDSTGLCYSKLTTNHETEVLIDNYRQSCNETPAFSLNLTLDQCQVVDVFGHKFPTQVTRLQDSGANNPTQSYTYTIGIILLSIGAIVPRIVNPYC